MKHGPLGYKEDLLTLLHTVHADKEASYFGSNQKPALSGTLPKAIITSRSRNLNDPDN